MNILYENDKCFVVADITPLSEGHLLVIPKMHRSYMHELDDDYLMNILPLIKRIINVLGYKKYNILQNNGHIQSVFHVHFHIVPFKDTVNSLKVKWETLKLDSNYTNTVIADIKDKLSKLK